MRVAHGWSEITLRYPADRPPADDDWPGMRRWLTGNYDQHGRPSPLVLDLCSHACLIEAMEKRPARAQLVAYFGFTLPVAVFAVAD